jgi:hypothetical protein
MTRGPYLHRAAPVFMCEALAIARRRRRFSGDANVLGAARQLAVNMPGYVFFWPRHASCDELGMATQMTNRRESDRVPMGVESALPWVPVPQSVQPPKAKNGVLRKLFFALAMLFLLLGLWQISKGLY